MRGVILAGGTGTRLRPTTRVINKHVIPIYDRPMIFYPARTLLDAGITEIMVVSTAEYLGKYIELLEAEFDADFRYKVQPEPKGIAHGVGLAEDFVGDDFVVLLGDNIFLDALPQEWFSLEEGCAKVFLKEVDDPSQFGVAVLEDGMVASLQEKPASPDSTYAVVGAYRYTSDVFRVIEDLDPSDRGEYEITDVNQQYAGRDELEYEILDGKWFDAGTPDGIFRAAREIRARAQDRSQ